MADKTPPTAKSVAPLAVVKMYHSKETKGTHLYLSEGDAAVGNIYLKKGGLNGGAAPRYIEITVKALEG